FRLPVRAAELILHDLDAVEPLLDVVAVHQNAHLVPFARRFHHTGGRWIQSVVGARGSEARLPIRVSGIVEDLHFRGGPVNRVAALPEGAVADSTAAGDRLDRAAVVQPPIPNASRATAGTDLRMRFMQGVLRAPAAGPARRGGLARCE